MADCNDNTDDSPDGSIEDLREDFESVAESFRDEAKQNIQDRAEGDPVGATTGSTGQFDPEPQDPFNPQPLLLCAYSSSDETRPLPRRSEAEGPSVPPIRSESLDVQADVLESGNSYTVECTIRNLGGKPARHVTVELYVEHYEPDARVDTKQGADEPQQGTVELEREYGVQVDPEKYRITGVTTMAPDSSISAFAVMDDSGPPFEKVLGYAADMPVAEDRTFTGIVNGKPDEFLSGEPVPDERDDFTLEVWETSLAPTRDVGPKGGGTSFFDDPDEYDGIHLASVPGRYVSDPDQNVDRRNQYLTSSVEDQDTSRVGRQSTSVPGAGARTVTFEYQPSESEVPAPRENVDSIDDGGPGVVRDPAPGVGRAVTALYARAYSLGASELPADLSALDHTTSRFVCRTELPRRP